MPILEENTNSHIYEIDTTRGVQILGEVVCVSLRANAFWKGMEPSALPGIGLVWFYGISTIVDYSLSNPVYTYVLNIYICDL